MILSKTQSEEFIDKSIIDILGKGKVNFRYIFIFILLSVNLFANDNVLLFKPYTASVFEPRIGSVINLTQDNLRLDIGSSFDLFRNKLSNELTYSIGGDFFTYTRLRSETNFKFPVETSDYYFGINSAANFKLFEQDFSSRLRLAHISSHLVDGYSIAGKFLKSPFSYSREFIDLSLALNKQSELLDYRIYTGFIYVYHTLPIDVNTFIPYIGVDFSKNIIKEIAISGGLDLRKGESDIVNIASQLGFNIKLYKEFGIFLGYYKYFGSSVHGMFYKEKDNYDGIGFQIIYF